MMTQGYIKKKQEGKYSSSFKKRSKQKTATENSSGLSRRRGIIHN